MTDDEINDMECNDVDNHGTPTSIKIPIPEGHKGRLSLKRNLIRLNQQEQGGTLVRPDHINCITKDDFDQYCISAAVTILYGAPTFKTAGKGTTTANNHYELQNFIKGIKHDKI
jgi:hypothetical protein